jgi:hypothetical protein
MRSVRLLAILTAVAAVGGCAGIGAAVDGLCATCCLSCLNGGGPVPRDSQVPDRDDTLSASTPASAPAMPY